MNATVELAVLVGTEPVDATVDVVLGVAAGGFADCDLLSIRRSPLERAPRAALVVGRRDPRGRLCASG